MAEIIIKVLIFTVFFTKIEVNSHLQESKPITEALQDFQVIPFIFEDTVRLNITWKNAVVSDEDAMIDILVQNNIENCMYLCEELHHPRSNIAIIPNLEISEPVDTIFPGCDYNVSLTFESETYRYICQVPECIGNYCACVTDQINYIKLLDVEHLQDDVYRVPYTSKNVSLETGNFYIVEIYYDNVNESNTFEVPSVKYKKNSFEIEMEYLNDDCNYVLYIKYKDADNDNPNCYYFAQIDFEAKAASDTNYYVILRIALCVVLIFSLSAMLYCFLRHRTSYLIVIKELKGCIFPNQFAPSVAHLSTTSLKCPHQEINMLYTPTELMDYTKRDAYEIFGENIIIKDVIGEGAFGKVYYAKAYNLNGLPGYTMVAVKQLRADAPKEELADFLAEIKMLKKIGVHKNIVKLLACVTRTQPYMMIMELVSTGDLKEYLLKLREIWVKSKTKRRFFPDDMEEKTIKNPGLNKEKSTKIPDLPPRSPRTPDFISKLLLSEGISTFDTDTQTPLLADMGGRPDPVLDHKELENFALQIATGMAYLEKIPVTHRDLAARNILITKDKVLKISDFGMSRTGPYINRTLRKVPLRWMAIEAIEDFKTDSKSDVWSFGVVLWEIGTLGAFPYENIPNELLPKTLKAGGRLPRPEICTDELYNLMQKCWLENPKLRPSFEDLVEHLNLKKKHAYVDFSQVNPTYVFPPTDKIYQSVTE